MWSRTAGPEKTIGLLPALDEAECRLSGGSASDLSVRSGCKTARMRRTRNVALCHVGGGSRRSEFSTARTIRELTLLPVRETRLEKATLPDPR